LGKRNTRSTRRGADRPGKRNNGGKERGKTKDETVNRVRMSEVIEPSLLCFLCPVSKDHEECEEC